MRTVCLVRKPETDLEKALLEIFNSGRDRETRFQEYRRLFAAEETSAVTDVKKEESSSPEPVSENVTPLYDTPKRQRTVHWLV